MGRSQDQHEDRDDRHRRWRPTLMAFFLRRVRNHSEAEDLTQEVFTRMLKRSDSYEQVDGFVFQIAQNLLIDRARHNIVRDRYAANVGLDEHRETDWLDPERIAQSRESMAIFTAALDQLSERTRRMFILSRVEKMTYDAIGASYGISGSAVKQQVAKAMAHVMRAMRTAE